MTDGARNAAARLDHRAFPKSWGAEFLRAGEVLFRAWAPGVAALILRLDGVDRTMSAVDGGWYELRATDVQAGAHYNLVLPDGTVAPDPASRAQQGGVHGASLVVDPTHYSWQNGDWTGRPWEEAILYELHVGTFTPEGTFRAASDRLPHLAALGVTAIEIMPVAQFGGDRGWGYDGVLPYAPHSAYGSPDDMKAFIDAAHGHGLMVLLDVVYNHFGPEGNYLHALAPAFFRPERNTPWGAAIAYEELPVRQFFTDNVLYWLEEFQLDGLRFDAVDQIHDPESELEILVEIADLVRSVFPDRQIHLTTEDNRNITRLHERDESGHVPGFTAEWNDDFHNAAHVAATGEIDGYYEDFAQQPLRHLARILAEGFAYQGEPSPHAGGEPRGVGSGHQPPVAFIDFLQNHDQVGNRALGERLSTLAEPRMRRVLSAMLMLSPHIPLLFMGEEWDEENPFYFFTDFDGALAVAVREGRRREFVRFAAFSNAERQRQIPDPNAEATFMASKLDWSRATGKGADWLAFTRTIIALRKAHVVPLLAQGGSCVGRVRQAEDGVIAVDWLFEDGQLSLRANLADEERAAPAHDGDVIFAFPDTAAARHAQGVLPGISLVVACDQGLGAT